VKLLAGVGAWLWTAHTLHAFVWSAMVGGAMALVMVLYRRAWQKHRDQFWMILLELVTIRNPEKLAAIAAERKSSMMLLPYGIPIAVGSILYFAMNNLLL